MIESKAMDYAIQRRKLYKLREPLPRPFGCERTFASIMVSCIYGVRLIPVQSVTLSSHLSVEIDADFPKWGEEVTRAANRH